MVSQIILLIMHPLSPLTSISFLYKQFHITYFNKGNMIAELTQLNSLIL